MVKGESENIERALLASMSRLADEIAELRGLLGKPAAVQCEYMSRHDIAKFVGTSIQGADRLIAQMKAIGLGDGIGRGKYPAKKVKEKLLELGS